MFRDLFSVLLIVLIIITGFFTYIIFFEIEEAKSPSFNIDREAYKIKPDFEPTVFVDKFKVPFFASLDDQEQWADRQEKLSDDYEISFSEIQFNKYILYFDQYSSDITKLREELDRQFAEYEIEADNILDKKIAYYTSMIDHEVERSLENLIIDYREEFEEFESELKKQRSNELLNYRLKLETLDLTDEQKKDYKDKIAEIELEKRIRINNKLNEIYYELKTASQLLNENKAEKVSYLLEKFAEKKNKLVANRKREIEASYLTYQQQRYIAATHNIYQAEELINEEKQEILAVLKIVDEVVKDDLEVLKSAYSTVNKERN